MHRRFAIAIVLVILTVGLLIYSAVNATAKAVVTVAELRESGGPRSNIRLGARVADAPIAYGNEAQPLLHFVVRDITPNGVEPLPAVYDRAMPDNLKAGRDVILEGSFDGTTFVIKDLVTQCPSKYVPPVPGAKVEP